MPKPSVETSLLQCLVSQHFTFTLQIRNMYFSVDNPCLPACFPLRPWH
jgi:hypothetical protein